MMPALFVRSKLTKVLYYQELLKELVQGKGYGAAESGLIQKDFQVFPIIVTTA